jgi:glycosyltransferase involved in cell wall biosynthesis
VEHGETGIVFPDGDAHAAALHVCDLALKKSERTRIGQAASQKVAENYSLSAMTESFVQLIDELFEQAIR